jgi:uncharacterized protein
MALRLSIFIFLSLFITVLLAVIQEQLQISFDKIIIPQIGPSIAYLIVALVFKDLKFVLNLGINKIIFFKSLLAIGIPLVLFGFGFYICSIFGISVSITADLLTALPTIILGIVAGAIGEEIGWRSFLQPFLEKKYSILIASVLVGVIWGLWHIGQYKNGLLFMSGFLLFTISASIVIAHILKGSQYNLILSTLFHIAINFGFYIFYKSALSNATMMLVNGIVWAIAASSILVYSKWFNKTRIL